MNLIHAMNSHGNYSHKRKYMNEFYRITCVIYIFLTLSPSLAYGQAQLNQPDYYNWFDELVGIENTGLYKGIVYVEKYRTINEHTKFYHTSNFVLGSVIYDGQSYFNIKMKYDVFEGDVLIRVENRLGGTTLLLIRDKIDGFTINDHTFVKIDDKDSEANNISGFFEVALKNSNFTFYQKHIKNRFKRKDRKNIYYEFKSATNEFLLFHNNAYHVIRNRKDVSKLFPSLKKDLDAFYNITGSYKKSNPNEFMLSLIRRLDILTSKENNTVQE